MRKSKSRRRAAFGPEQLSELSTIFEDIVTCVAAEGMPYHDQDRERLSLEVAATIMDAATEGLSDRLLIERRVLQRLASSKKPAKWHVPLTVSAESR